MREPYVLQCLATHDQAYSVRMCIDVVDSNCLNSQPNLKLAIGQLPLFQIQPPTPRALIQLWWFPCRLPRGMPPLLLLNPISDKGRQLQPITSAALSNGTYLSYSAHLTCFHVYWGDVCPNFLEHDYVAAASRVSAHCAGAVAFVVVFGPIFGCEAEATEGEEGTCRIEHCCCCCRKSCWMAQLPLITLSETRRIFGRYKAV